MRRNEREGPSWDELRDWLSVASDDHETRAALRRFARGHGFRWFTYLWLQDTNIRGISNYPSDWQRRYLTQKLALIDPIVTLARHANSAFSWSNGSNVLAHSRQQAQFMRDAGQIGIRFGYTIPIKAGYGMRAALTLSGPDAPSENVLTADQFYALSAGAFLHGYLERSSVTAFDAPECPLTHYQLECLSWLVQGKTNKEIGIIRGVTERAVELQLSAVREKLGTVSTIQSVAIAVERKWVLA
ncbi:DNA-binding transcriptional regulator, CsgD family [Pelagibacterium luteolum]|uniref:DNA-binding transcriptional regulator, CsgD family n=2 Tax=Pelagibacterium luteolum TaxID=440168 RepID=A0A1G7ZZD2_9HYPH|nr:DNA-binding transcriptional regulator, CsgD family [Pelagibacterium luteolum]